ncbi:glycosyltransferase family 4 protein [Oscillatoria sp. FACHB-1406]|uniref:glycosyltransferase family 4 protein n=1 Tax=Oscillatoria sp. FACHB-1406 TaxID=2692846 RepID=UPI00168800A2|nr:glycosyltransferase family 4 protein [Oscillatoria sp. FACHB-1406]MBD2578182.1 glycosyltransferase family 4 protein [Oscillatoria sp. FACHB-1406]
MSVTSRKILIYSPVFYPSIGGIETVISILAEGFFRRGWNVKVVCQTPATDRKTFPFEVVRCPSAQALLQLTRWCDVFFQACVSLKGLWPLIIAPKPLVITHQTWYRRLDGGTGWQDCLKLQVARVAINIAPSQAVANQLPVTATVIPNPYAEDIFYRRVEIRRDREDIREAARELIFVGRLVSDKGTDLLLEALTRLQHQGLTPQLTIAGSGPEATNLQQQVQQLGLTEQVQFVGSQKGEALAQLLNAHRILVVPSRWEEPFGIVALEGMACGCYVVGSEAGGLKEAIGVGGKVFPNGDVAALTEILGELLSKGEPDSNATSSIKTHLQRHQTNRIVEDYLAAIEANLP